MRMQLLHTLYCIDTTGNIGVLWKLTQNSNHDQLDNIFHSDTLSGCGKKIEWYLPAHTLDCPLRKTHEYEIKEHCQ